MRGAPSPRQAPAISTPFMLTLDGASQGTLTNSGPLEVVGTLTLEGTIDNTGVISLVTYAATASLAISGNVALEGDGKIVLGDYDYTDEHHRSGGEQRHRGDADAVQHHHRRWHDRRSIPVAKHRARRRDRSRIRTTTRVATIPFRSSIFSPNITNAGLIEATSRGAIDVGAVELYNNDCRQPVWHD